MDAVKIYSVGVWNVAVMCAIVRYLKLKFTPLEFETRHIQGGIPYFLVKIYSVGVWNYQNSEPFSQDVKR